MARFLTAFKPSLDDVRALVGAQPADARLPILVPVYRCGARRRRLA